MNKRPPYPDPDRLVSVVKVSPAGEEPILDTDFLALRSESQTFESIAAYVFRGLILTDGSAPERIDSAIVSAEVFQTLGVKPSLGRALLPEESRAGRNRVAVISYNLWQRRFSGDPKLIGRTITLDQDQYTVIGVMASDFRFPQKCDAWMPLAFDDEGLRLEDKSLGLEVIARLKPSVTLQQAQADTDAIARKLERIYPMTNIGRDIKVVSLQERLDQKKVLEIKIHRPVNPPAETGKEK
ncbi:MAG: ABC transporter permease [Acidobacteria bacterium]|nr:ABC transporter permease [Acidobacteriota bacterium]